MLTYIYSADGAIYPFTVAKGDAPQPLQQSVREVSRPGVNGHAFRWEGKRSEPFEIIVGRDHTSVMEAVDFLLRYRELVGSLVTYVDQMGVRSDSVMVHNMRREPMSRMIGISGRRINAAPGYWQWVRFTLQLTILPPAPNGGG
ncbi:MAG TPA: hypothetical protein VGN72_19760 [Tepidisphaeraceae bacterium]|jgi:hypothetical protein|nr:hypothetical protein [Tepidisphaeraceae bacterium]